MRCSSLILATALLPVALTAQMSMMSRGHDIPLKPWAAPLYWQPTQVEAHAAGTQPDLSASLSPQATTPTSSLVFVAMTPCRVVDTRSGSGFIGAYGAPSLNGNSARTFPIQSSSSCTIPAIAQAYSFNVTVVPPGPLTYITIYPTGQALPNASTLNDFLGTVVANAAIVPAGNNGSVDVFASDRTDLIIDINGYYAPQGFVMQGAASTAIGSNALSATVFGGANTAIGSNAMAANTNGLGGTATGANSLARNTTGSLNTADGSSALGDNTTGQFNTASGAQALQLNTTGDYNTGNGYLALYNTGAMRGLGSRLLAKPQ